MLSVTSSRLGHLGILATSLLAFSCQSINRDRSVLESTQSKQTLSPDKIRNVWEGWGTSLSWWANAVGKTPYESTLADAMFTDKTVSVMNREIPGLNFNIARYNIGGGGRPGDTSATEMKPDILDWYKDIDGFWINWNSKDPNSSSYDWTRDDAQRSVLKAAMARGVTKIEFFANSPMWWMMDSKSSAGGRLQSWNRRDYAAYLANVVQYADFKWGVKATSLEAFNEPNAGWWVYPQKQEGSNITTAEQKEILGYLREEFDKRGLKIPLVGSDENTMEQAIKTYEDFKRSEVNVSGSRRKVSDLIEKVNVHSYNGLDSWRDNSARTKLKKTVDGKRLWCSEYGGPDTGGAELAQTIMEDLSHLHPHAWVYWQAIEPYSGWGLINAEYAKPDVKDRGKVIWIYTKYYVMAQFSRFIRPGMNIIEQDDTWSVVGHDPKAKLLSIVSVNRNGSSRTLEWDLTPFGVKANQKVNVVSTSFNGDMAFKTREVDLKGQVLSLTTTDESISSLSIKL